MPIQLDNAQYNAFVSFALGANDENAIAHAGAAPAFANIVFKCALSGEPELAKILGEHSEELMNETALLIPPKDGGTMSMLVGAMPAVRELAAEL